ncbi:MAG: threonylcarbamoyl-AMP synthase [Alicyclobacillus sp.]|nr:threonylcarbamoyl-AMP synthase [Alicyclobacillus sp.]
MQVWRVAAQAPLTAQEDLRAAAACLREGGLVAFPTETVYGLGANATLDTAVRAVFTAKGRPQDNPLIVHLPHPDCLDWAVSPAADLPPTVRRAMDAFWPGPLTLLLPAHPRLAFSVHPGLERVGVRVPDHPVAQALLRLAECPVAAPSANRSGRPSPTTAEDVIEDLEGHIDGVVDGGPCGVGVESTVAWVDARRVVIYRPGGVTPEQLAEVCGVPVTVDPAVTGERPVTAPLAPGMKYRHYAPDAQVWVWWGDLHKVQAALAAFVAAHPGQRIAALVPPALAEAAPASGLAAGWVWVAPAAEPYDVALSRALFRQLRRFDRLGADHILVVGVAPQGLGLAVMNRLAKASAGRVWQV